MRRVCVEECVHQHFTKGMRELAYLFNAVGASRYVYAHVEVEEQIALMAICPQR